MSAETKPDFYKKHSIALKIARTIFAAGVVYGGANALIDLGGGLEAQHIASNSLASATEHQSATHDEQDAFHDAEKQALIAVIGAAGLAFTRKRDV